MNNKKLFTDKRWTDIPKATVIGHFESSEEEKIENEKKLLEHLKKTGVITEDEEKELNKKARE